MNNWNYNKWLDYEMAATTEFTLLTRKLILCQTGNKSMERSGEGKMCRSAVL